MNMILFHRRYKIELYYIKQWNFYDGLLLVLLFPAISILFLLVFFDLITELPDRQRARHCACWQTLVWRHSQMARQMVAQLWRHYKMTSKSHMKNHMSWSWRKVNCLFSLLRQEYPLILTSGEMLSHPGGWDKPIPEVNHLWRHRTSTLNNAEKSHLVCVLYLLYN